MTKYKELTIYSTSPQTKVELPLAQGGISAGFPSPADEPIELKLDLNRELIRNPSATFFARVSGVSMRDDGVDDGDLLLIDKSVEPYDGCLAVCYIDGDFTLKRFKDNGDHALLMPANKDYKPLKVTADNDFMVWGVVRYLIKKM